MAADIYNLMAEAWTRIGPRIISDEDELRARLARRRSPMYARPPRPFCAVIRANDLRIHPNSAPIYPTDALDPADPGQHNVTLDSAVLRLLTQCINVPHPGLQAPKLAALLGISVFGIHKLIKNRILLARYLPNLGGKHGHPVPLVHTRGDFDPCACGYHRRGPERLWDELRRELPSHIPDDLTFTLTRVPQMHHVRSRTDFNGWRWLCPGCNRTANTLYLPLDLPDFADLHKIPVPPDELALTPHHPQMLACSTCHRIFKFSARSPQTQNICWNHAILHLSGGLLYGDEVNRPDWMKIAPAKTRYHLERDPDHEAHEAERLKRERFMRKFDSQPIWVNGKLNPLFNQDD